MKSYTVEEARSWFQEVADLVGSAFKKQCPHFIALAGKWASVDLVPGLSDMDFRVICDEQTTVDDWIHIDHVMGRSLLEIASNNPQWNRINEHTAGAGMTVSEMMDDRFYNPEYSVLDIWYGERNWLDKLKSDVAARPFGYFDEYTHFLRFLTYYSPYIHGIDPPINPGCFEPKYALHSRCWHYFAPPMMSAACILAGRKFLGKRDSLTWLCQNGHAAEQVRAVLGQVEAHYETPELDDPDHLGDFENFLFEAFKELYPRICESIRFLEIDFLLEPSEIKKQLRDNHSRPLQMLMDNLRWARTRAGRYFFYLNAPRHYSATHQLKGELIWVRKLTGPTFDIIRYFLGELGLGPAQCLERLDIEVSASAQKVIDHMFSMPDEATDENKLRELYIRAVDLYPVYYRLLELAVWKVAQKSCSET